MTNGASPAGSLAAFHPALFLRCCSSLPRGSRSSVTTRRPGQGSFASLVAGLSEPAGLLRHRQPDFERTVVPARRAGAAGARRPRGGVYLGVGPDQNFSYIAHLRPSLAIIIDIRRDNLLLHLLFKALFAEARTRIAYLAMLTGRSPPPEAREGRRSVEEIVGYIDRAPPLRDGDLRGAARPVDDARSSRSASL